MVGIDNSKNRIPVLVLKIVVAFWFLFSVLHKTNFSVLEEVSTRVDLMLVFYGGILTFLTFLGEVIRSHILFKPYSKKIQQMFRYRMAAMSLNNLLPSSLSGEFYVALMYGKEVVRKLMLRNFFMLFVNFVLVSILALGVAIQNDKFAHLFTQIDYVFWGSLMITGIVSALIFLFCFQKLEIVSKSCNYLLTEWNEIKVSTLLSLLFLTLVNIAFRVSKFYILLLSFDVSLDISLLIILVFFLNIVFLLPVMLGGIGVVEASAVGVLVFLGVGAEEALMVALINRLYIIGLGVFGLYFLVQNKRQSKVND